MIEQYEVMHDPTVGDSLQNCNTKSNIGRVAAAFQQAMKTPGNGTNDEGEALKQLQGWAPNNTHLYKLINMKPKWGLDFSIDYCDREGNVFELLHWEYDGFQHDEIAENKTAMEQFLKQQDWQDRAKTMLERKSEWHHLGFFEQSEWKTRFFGIEKERFKMVLWK